MGQPDNLTTTNRFGLGSLTLKCVLLLLSVAVFNWGLQYKMSLYQNVGGPAHASVAKLWTGSRDSAQASHTSVSLEEQAPVPPQATFLIAFPVLFVALKNRRALVTFFRWRRIAGIPKPHLAAFQNALFFRPPPAIL